MLAERVRLTSVPQPGGEWKFTYNNDYVLFDQTDYYIRWGGVTIEVLTNTSGFDGQDVFGRYYYTEGGYRYTMGTDQYISGSNTYRSICRSDAGVLALPEPNYYNGVWYYETSPQTRVYMDDFDVIYYFYYAGSLVDSGPIAGYPTDSAGRAYYDNGTYRYTMGVTLRASSGDSYYYSIARTLTGVVPSTTGD